jgi:hypothetical protein
VLVQGAGVAQSDVEHADALAVTKQRQCGGRADMPFLQHLAPGQRTLVVDIIVADARPLAAKCFAAETQTLGRARINRYLGGSQPFDMLADARG